MYPRKYFTLNFLSMKYFLSKTFQTTVYNIIAVVIFKPGARRPCGRRAPGFLKLILCGLSVCVRACVCVCLRPRLLIISGVMWRDIDLIRLVKQVPQLLYGNCSRYR